MVRTEEVWMREGCIPVAKWKKSASSSQTLVECRGKGMASELTKRRSIVESEAGPVLGQSELSLECIDLSPVANDLLLCLREADAHFQSTLNRGYQIVDWKPKFRWTIAGVVGGFFRMEESLPGVTVGGSVTHEFDVWIRYCRIQRQKDETSP